MNDCHPDAFQALAALMALISDPKATQARLHELREATAAAEKAQAELAAKRQKFAAEHAAGMASLAGQAKALEDERQTLRDRRRALDADLREVARRKANRAEQCRISGVATITAA
jgi:predicted  nucleic acid-binding Zn-ribbon protein